MARTIRSSSPRTFRRSRKTWMRPRRTTGSSTTRAPCTPIRIPRRPRSARSSTCRWHTTPRSTRQRKPRPTSSSPPRSRIKNRPKDEHRFQIKYGGDLSGLHEIWQDPYGLYVTLLVGINPEQQFFVAADPVLRSPTRFSVSVEFKDQQACEILDRKWVAWERERHPAKRASDEPL